MSIESNKGNYTGLSFSQLAESIIRVNARTGNAAKGAVNQLMTIRNWIIGYYVVEFEQHGKERAKYGAHLLKTLEERIQTRGLNETLFKLSRMFYLRYPQVGTTAFRLLQRDTATVPSAFLPVPIQNSDVSQKSATASHEFVTDGSLLVSRLSFSHIREIMTIDDALERFFYETECIRGCWNIRELRRQIATNLFFRSGISRHPEKLLPRLSDEQANTLSVRDPFTFEFLGLEAKDTVSEDDLEQGLIDNIQSFLLELGKGFCFEARQKRIIIDDQYYFADLIFYNRLLHCNVIIELKNDKFKHEYLGQLNAYVGYYRDNEMMQGDNPPIGILLCTQKGPKMVEYALSGMDNQLFVSTYMLQLPSKGQLKELLLKHAEDVSKNN